MKITDAVATLLSVACLFAVASCKAPPPPVVMGPTSSVTLPERNRVLVVETLSANFGTNKTLFDDRFRALATACQVITDVFELPHAGGPLTLDPPVADQQRELGRRTNAFQPDAILELGVTAWTHTGGLGDNSAQLTGGTFKLAFRVLDGRKRTVLWQDTGTLQDGSRGGGDALASALVKALTAAGLFRHCPSSPTAHRQQDVPP